MNKKILFASLNTKLSREILTFFEMAVKYGIIEEWQTRILQKQDGDRLKQNSKENKLFRGC
nr:hypothetical protein [Streptococcus oralis]